MASTSNRSRVFRQIVTLEVIWAVEPGESVYRDWEAEFRSAVLDHAEPSGWPGIGVVTDVEELTANG